MSELTIENLIVDKTYNVVGSDCCIDFVLEGELTAIKYRKDSPGEQVINELTFGHTRLLYQFYSYEFKEVSGVD